MFKFKLIYVALAAAMTSTYVYADPTTYTLPSDTKVIDIEAPNAAGVSHNLYRDFSVDDKGAILNNSSVDYQHETLGTIAKNNNLSAGSASVILNEVISKTPSKLQGFIEVAGQKADVIIANPYGITCSGCSFINTSNVVLTTGKVNMADTGAISSYAVTGGIVNVGTGGLNAPNSYVSLLADVINLNDMVTAQHAQLSAGNFLFDNATGAITPAGKEAGIYGKLSTTYSIDISSLGGVKANSITMVGNNLGFGVRNKGAIVANAGLSMTSNGSLVNEGTINGNGVVSQLASLGEFNNSGKISTNYFGTLISYGNFNNSGTITNGMQMAIAAAGNMQNTGYIKGAQSLEITTNGDLTTKYLSEIASRDKLAITTLGSVNNGGGIYAKNIDAKFGGSAFNVTGYMTGSEKLSIKATKNDKSSSGKISNSGTLTGGDVELITDGDLYMAKYSLLEVNKSLNTRSFNFDNAGVITGIKGQYGDLYFDNYSTTNTGQIVGQSVKFNTWYDMLNEGMLEGRDTLEIDTQGNGNFTNRSSIYAGTLKISAKKVFNGGYRCGFMGLATCGVGNINADKLVLKSTHNYASEMGGVQKIKNIEINTVK